LEFDDNDNVGILVKFMRSPSAEIR